MRLIDADELIEHVWRDRVDSRERIANLVESMPTIKETKEKRPRFATAVECSESGRWHNDQQRSN